MRRRKGDATVRVKICGLTTAPTLEAALSAGADMVGFVFFPKSPRHLRLAAAPELAAMARGKAEIVALMVDPDDAMLDMVTAALGPDLLQLHGKESPERVRQIRDRVRRPVMKALGVASAADLAPVAAYAEAADRLLIDAKPPAGAALPGGNGVAFDWRLVKGFAPKRPWLLSGGLGPGNVAEAIRLTNAPGVDVSSGVERAPGVKDEAMIAAFVAAARGAAA
ncbi:MAG: phosphoribosylanthranilate isomerase [Rhizobiales bacterium]|nr:phosphoribosylanthranilate isomerase [Hyphomicrobiales bacterium]